MKIQPILICIVFVILIYCSKERSCEGCYQPPPIQPDTTTTTIPNELITTVSIHIQDESKVRIIYPQVMTKKWPGHHQIIDSIKMKGINQYDSSYDLKKYLNMNDYQKGDTFFFRCGIRWRQQTETYVEIDTLIL